METKRFDLSGEFSASDLEDVIRTLAETRACMTPPVPEAAPSHPDAEQQILVQDESKFTFRKLANGGLRIWLRNEGIGWLAFTLTAADVLGIREFLNKQGTDGTNH